MNSNCLARVLRKGDGDGLARLRHIDVDVVDPRATYGLKKLAGDDGSGEARLGPLEGVLGAVARKALGSGDAGARSNDALITRDADVHLGGEAVGIEPDHRKPAAGIQQHADRILHRSEVDAFHRAGLRSLQSA